jgi:hypothetical protein
VYTLGKITSILELFCEQNELLKARNETRGLDFFAVSESGRIAIMANDKSI